jgi:D-alanyl-D-alanine dipeptidase
MSNLRFKKHKTIKIKELDEPLIDVRKVCPKVFIALKPERIKEKTYYVRKSVANRLNKASKLLPKGYYLKLRDAYRPIKFQEYYYKKTYRKLKKIYKNYSSKKLEKLLNSLVYPLNKDIPPHSTGGAVDVNLIRNLKTGHIVKLSTSKLPRYEQNEITNKKIPKNIQKNREILYKAMTKAGFVNNTKEWWHYSFGDKDWAMLGNKKYAIYGQVPDKLLPKLISNIFYR